VDNAALAEALLTVAEALDFLEENPFKAKAYQKAARSIMEMGAPARDIIEHGDITTVAGIGSSIGSVLKTWVVDRDFSLLTDLKARLPHGYFEMIKVPGLGMKKLRTLHRELGLSSVDDLLAAIDDGRLAGLKGFSDKGIARMRRSVLDVIGYRGWYLLDAAWSWMETMIESLSDAGLSVLPTGVCRRGMEVIEGIELLCLDRDGAHDAVQSCLGDVPGGRFSRDGSSYSLHHPEKTPVKVWMEAEESLVPALFVTTGSPSHLEQALMLGERRGVRVSRQGVSHSGTVIPVKDEADIYALLGMPYLPPEVREGRDMEWKPGVDGMLGGLVTRGDLRGILHVHTSMSDGHAPLKDMVRAAKDRGYCWIGISDHSRNAYYAGGLSVKDLKRQGEEIDALNREDPGFTILKGIESDILPDGSLDYPDNILKQLDFVVASVHSHMDMDRDAMTERIVRAIRNPFTSMIGHPTGRLLLSRRPYEVDMDAVVEEAARQGVSLELNAHPMRLDLDARLIQSFVSRGGRLAINPDAHTPDGLDDVRYGIVIARKGFLTSRACINCLDARTAKEALAARWS